MSILSCEQGIAGVMNEYHCGKVVLLGTFAGHTIATYEHAQSRAFMLKLVEDAGVLPERCGKLLRQRRVWKDEEAWFLINPSAEPVTEKVEVAGFSRVEDLLEKTLLDIEAGSIVVVEPFNIRRLVLNSKNTWRRI